MRILLIAWTTLYFSDGLAWGNLGHRITGLVATELLTPAAKREVESLLGEESLADAATFMDTHRDELKDIWPQSARWHYDNREVCSNTLHCRAGDCATHQVERFETILADKSAPKQQRALALRLVIHMIGDIHQPLHMSDNNDRGGNDLWVRLYAGAEQKNLHYVLDTELVRDNVNRRRDYDYSHELVVRHRANISHWQQGTLSQWADESFAIGKQDVYRMLPAFSCAIRDDHSRTITLPPDYVQRARQNIELQLAKAGARIAAVLNETLSGN